MKKKIFVFLLVLINCISLTQVARAGLLADGPLKDIESNNTSLTSKAGFSETANYYDIISAVISVFLGLLGLIFVVIVILAGYKYFTAQGEQGKTKEALDSIRRAVIGLIIIVSAYAITAFVFKNISF